MTSRRSFLLGLGTALAAPAIVRAESLMQIAVLRESVDPLTLTGTYQRLIHMPPAYRGSLLTVEAFEQAVEEAMRLTGLHDLFSARTFT
jgi:hypothetical protein